MNKKAIRFEALDITRGFAILTMVLSGVIPYKILPDYMYHAQIPPPDHVYDPNLPGLTWVDLVFPLFIFCLGAAIPFAIGYKLRKGTSKAHIVVEIFKRFGLLVIFSIILQHFRPHQMLNPPDTITWIKAIIGFVVLFCLFVKLPERFGFYRYVVRAIGWSLTLLIIFTTSYHDPSGFSAGRNDIILLVLSYIYLFSALLFLFEDKKNIIYIFTVLGLLAFRLTHNEIEFVGAIWNWNPLPSIYSFRFLQYLFIAIPGIIAGKIYLSHYQETPNSAPGRNYIILILILIFLVVATLIGFQERIQLFSFIISIALILLGFYIVKKYQYSLFTLISFGAGVILLLIGYFTENYEGGIKKDPSTLSYFFITSGLSYFILLSFTLLIKKYKQLRFLTLLSQNGKNPMIAYVAFGNLLWPIIAITGLEPLILAVSQDILTGLIRGIAYTLIIAMITAFFTKKNIYWKT
ncbi:DUF5009 domain-containing protein [Mangrovivirga cuniculi]|uniref:DUF5009 domain-containing protein n=1 Tax=Mangrovivirga cuniculi TaxID=2715131 RepID=A0A4D7K3H3_9BACT|nr:DUF5009 domain-containing protein [Mangrovivirga cuniculi]QCK15394.1 DUF5009 domain-containing protein [Mangrovivirga cuniculi]